MNLTVIVILVVVGIVGTASLVGWWRRRAESGRSDPPPTFQVIDGPQRAPRATGQEYVRDDGFVVKAHAHNELGYCFRHGRLRQECGCAQPRY